MMKGSVSKPKYFFRNAIDRALISNQSRAVTSIINYIIQYQNNYISSFLFTKNFPKILEMGIEIAPLLNSKVFLF